MWSESLKGSQISVGFFLWLRVGTDFARCVIGQFRSAFFLSQSALAFAPPILNLTNLRLWKSDIFWPPSPESQRIKNLTKSSKNIYLWLVEKNFSRFLIGTNHSISRIIFIFWEWKDMSSNFLRNFIYKKKLVVNKFVFFCSKIKENIDLLFYPQAGGCPLCEP